ncbi:MAG: ATP-binding cassette domain-containing protein [Gemmatimonadetes bacterium]|nr:ATP-binding cassette domain-containing protein [Gemmatimonadota bacterium]
MTDPAATETLRADIVVKRYGAVTALDGVSLSVGAGETVALVGESGSGKTTLLRCFNRLVCPDEGTIRIDGIDIWDTDPILLRRATGYVQQEGGLLPHWTVLRNAGLVPRLQALERPDALAAEALELVGLSPDVFGPRWPSQLSGGQRQRVAIARALAAKPSRLLLDEPFGALDAITRSELQAVLLDLRRRLHITTLLVTHDLHEAALLADRIAVMRAGRIVQIAEPETLLREPATGYVDHLLKQARLRPVDPASPSNEGLPGATGPGSPRNDQRLR